MAFRQGVAPLAPEAEKDATVMFLHSATSLLYKKHANSVLPVTAEKWYGAVARDSAERSSGWKLSLRCKHTRGCG